MSRKKAAGAEVVGGIERTSKSTPQKRRSRNKLSEKTTDPGEKCLYSWTCGPRSDGRCPFSPTCADWRRPIVLCAWCIYGKQSKDECGELCVLCMREQGSFHRMPLNGYCSEGILDRYQDAARYIR